MPGNIITINGVTEYYVGDSKMPGLIEYLDKFGYKEEKKAGQDKPSSPVEEVKKE